MSAEALVFGHAATTTKAGWHIVAADLTCIGMINQASLLQPPPHTPILGSEYTRFNSGANFVDNSSLSFPDSVLNGKEIIQTDVKEARLLGASMTNDVRTER